MSQSPVRVNDGKVDPGEVGAVARRPDDGVHLELAFILEAHGAARRSKRARLQLDAVAPLELARARSDQRVPVPQLAPQPRFDGLEEEARLRQPPEEIAAGYALRQRLLLRADREQDLVRGRKLLGDLEARVSAPDHEHGSFGHVARPSVTSAVGLPHARVEVLGELGHERCLERPGRDHNLVGGDRPAADLEDEAPALVGEPAHLAVELDRKLEGLRIAFEVGDHLVARRIAIRVARKGEARQRAVAARREESQRVPALAPGRRD